MPDHTPTARSRTPLDDRHSLGTLAVSPLALGGNVFGWTADEPASFAVLDAYLAAGGNFIDTADVYSAWADGNSGGESETVIGNWLAGRGSSVREQVVVATKVGAHPEHKGVAAQTIKAGAEDSLRRLRTDHIDLYYTHFDDESVEVSEIITALDDLVREGKVREIAASNIAPARLQASLDFSAREGLARYVALQPHYNLMSRDTYEGELERIAAREGLGVMSYFALASGFLTGKYQPGRQPEASVPHASPTTSPPNGAGASSPPSTRWPARTKPPPPPSPSHGSRPSPQPRPHRERPQSGSAPRPPGCRGHRLDGGRTRQADGGLGLRADPA